MMTAEQTNENWKPAPHLEDHYLLSDEGKFTDVSHTTKTKNGHTRSYFDQPMKISVRPGQRPSLNLCWHGMRKTVLVDRLVLETFGTKPAYPDEDVEHIDGDIHNCHILNLRWVKNQNDAEAE